MEIIITAPHFNLTPPLKEHIHKKIDHLKQLQQSFSAVEVCLVVEKRQSIVRMVARGVKDKVFCQSLHRDMYSAINQAVIKLEKQILKYKKRNRQ